MSSEDLTAPLGMGKKRLDRLPFGLIGVGILSLVVTITVIWIAVVDDPLGGEPVAVLPLETVVEGVTSRDIEIVEIQPGDANALGPNLKPTSADNLLGPRYELIERPDGLGPDAPVTRLSIAPDGRVSERSDYGFLPKISAAGVRPLDAYARPNEREFTSIPKIAIIITGLGLSETGTQTAISGLPDEVTFALSPYGDDLDQWMQQARTKGHELLLQLPLEPFDYPDNDPGPHTLLVSLRPAELLDRLAYLLTRVTNYVGVIPEMGARFTSTEPSVEYLVEKLKSRGLMLVDNGSSSRSIAGQVAADKRMPFSGVDVVLDELPKADSIDAKLLQLEGVARARGVAVAVGSALPVTMRQLERWVVDLEDRGLQLVPVSATIDR